MKHNEIEALLEKRRAGTLTDDELAELNTLSRRDEVMADAERRADTIVRRRRSSVMAFSSIAAIGIGAALLTMPQKNETQTIAMQTTSMTVEKTHTVAPTPMAEAQTEPVQVAAAKPTAAKHKPATVKATAKSDEPVVVCNSQCNADSVISDIWKFLSA